ncbi:ATP-binding cassette domain-containing protein [Thalassospira lucentensis]|uniref:ATP-binding cassette domain-containing protein n=1 Tax=Thalassospira lucentensis TaxID=168935 RepID=UPI003AA8680E
MKQLLQASGLGKTFGGVTAARDVSIEISEKQVVCVIGANGAGKSTLFNMLCGALTPDVGQVIFDGESLVGLPLHEFARKGIARKFQVPSVFGSLTVNQNLKLSCRDTSKTKTLDTRTERMLERIDLVELRDVTASLLAHGQKQWLEIGMALMSQPRLLLLDEPTAGMTPEETQKTADLILSAAEETAVMAIEHDMGFVRALNCQTYVMHQGEIIVQGDFKDVGRNERVRDVYLGKA